MVENILLDDYQKLIREYACRNIQKYVAAISSELTGINKSEDIECIHRARVASRRLRSSLRLFIQYIPERRRKRWPRIVRGITSTLGAARDLDVQSMFLNNFLTGINEPRLKTGIRRLLLRLRQKRKTTQEQVTKSLDRLVKKNTLMEMDKYCLSEIPDLSESHPNPSELYYLACQSIEKCLSDFLDFEKYIHDPNRLVELHLMRIAAKRLRYAMEIFAPMYPGQLKQYIDPTRTCQDILGEIHDMDVWQSSLQTFLEDERGRVMEYCESLRPWNTFLPGIAYLTNYVVNQRLEKYQAFLEEWQNLLNKSIWSDLRKTIHQPIQSHPIFPPSPVYDSNDNQSAAVG